MPTTMPQRLHASTPGHRAAWLLFGVASSLALGLACLPARAASSAASSASDSLTTSVGSISTSVQKSSNSSSQATGVAAGDYRIIDVATLPDRPGMVRLQLQAEADASPEGALWLVLPQTAVQAAALQTGEVVNAAPRAYGVQFGKAVSGSAPQAFFLVLADDWHDELQTRALVL